MLLALAIAAVTAVASAQGVFFGHSIGPPTRIGSIDGPAAGTNIFGQYLAGPTLDSLMPVEPAGPHTRFGGFAVGLVTVPTVPVYQSAYVQKVAWDSTLWGTDWSQVPSDQFGRTDVTSVLLTTGFFPDDVLRPRFMQPAIVPVPEPSVWALAGVGVLLVALRKRLRG